MAKTVDSINLNRDAALLPDGAYKLRVENIEVKEGNAAPYLAIRFRVVNGSGTIFHNVSLAENAAFFRNQFLDACALPTEGSLKITALRGKSLWANVTETEYNGQPRNAIKNFLLPEVGEKLATSAAQAAASNKAFAAKMVDPAEETDFFTPEVVTDHTTVGDEIPM